MRNNNDSEYQQYDHSRLDQQPDHQRGGRPERDRAGDTHREIRQDGDGIHGENQPQPPELSHDGEPAPGDLPGGGRTGMAADGEGHGAATEAAPPPERAATWSWCSTTTKSAAPPKATPEPVPEPKASAIPAHHSPAYVMGDAVLLEDSKEFVVNRIGDYAIRFRPVVP